jgi:ubiquinone/menaquinone biosynthesis C-methylase UbiE
MTLLERLAYDVGQGARVAWYLGHYRLAQRRIEGAPSAGPIKGALPTREAMLRDLWALFARDRANIAAGRYRLPHDLVADPVDALRRSRLFLDDLAEVNRRRQEDAHQEVFHAATVNNRYPRYYLQNFHYQSDGWLSERSAELYDFQVEVLFNGGADAMRRQALVPLGEHLRGRRIADQPLLDVACGTGRFLSFVKHNWPRLPVTGLDLSRPYLEKARRHLAPWSWVRLVEGDAERLPFADGSFALVTCVYLFHELPREVRIAVAREMARVLRPGGRLLLMDSFQHGDRPEVEGLLELFPRAYHEPYFTDYARHDLVPLFAEAGLTHAGGDIAFMSKVMAFDRPAT